MKISLQAKYLLATSLLRSKYNFPCGCILNSVAKMYFFSTTTQSFVLGHLYKASFFDAFVTKFISIVSIVLMEVTCPIKNSWSYATATQLLQHIGCPSQLCKLTNNLIVIIIALHIEIIHYYLIIITKPHHLDQFCCEDQQIFYINDCMV